MVCCRLEKLLGDAFQHLGRAIGRHPLAVLGLSLLFTAFCCLGFFAFDEVNNVRTEYSPDNAASRKEYEVAKAFLNQNGTLDPSYIMVQARDEGSLLRDEYRLSLVNFTKFLQHDVRVEHNGRVFAYTDLCEPYCELNTAFLAFLRLYRPEEPSTHTYPSVELFVTQAFIGNNVYGIRLKEGSNELESFSTAILPFYLVSSFEDSPVIYKWCLAAKTAFAEYPQFKVGMTGDSLVSAEVRRMGFETAPLMALSIAFMIVFVVCSSFRRVPSRAKVWESLAGCLVPLLALASTTALLSLFGLKFQSIIVASLFLVLSVGVDDVFIILRAWDRTAVSDPVPQRLAITLDEAGPSITISSLTNAMSFMIGIASSTPAIRSFSLFSAVAIIICYFYQLILFTAILSLSGRREEKGKQAILCWRRANPEASCLTVERVVQAQEWTIRTWSAVICSWPARLVVVLILLVYYAISAYGVTLLHSNISIEKMALPDSYLQNFQDKYEQAMRNMQPISVFVLNPGDLRDPERLATIKTIVQEYENATNSYGPNSTFFWLSSYQEFLESYNEEEGFTYTEIPTFFKSASYFYLSSFVKFNESACEADEPACVSSFFFMTNFHDVIKYHEMIPALLDWRRIAAKYSDYKVFAYSDHSPFVDQTLSIDSTVWSSVLAALLCTTLACFVFIPHLPSILCCVFSVMSITLGLLGLLALWGLDLDPLTTASFIMAIGFSVDFSSHICYHFYKSEHDTPVKKVEDTLSAIGWPLMQVGLSTIVAVSPLLLKPSYLAIVFLKTIVVVVLLGIVHGIVVLPALLSLLVRRKPPSSPSSSSDVSERSSQRSAETKESFYKRQQLIHKHGRDLWANLSSAKSPAAVSPEEACAKPAFTHHIALGRTLSS